MPPVKLANFAKKTYKKHTDDPNKKDPEKSSSEGEGGSDDELMVSQTQLSAGGVRKNAATTATTKTKPATATATAPATATASTIPNALTPTVADKEKEKFDKVKYRKMLSEMFPSTYMKALVKADELAVQDPSSSKTRTKDAKETNDAVTKEKEKEKDGATAKDKVVKSKESKESKESNKEEKDESSDKKKKGNQPVCNIIISLDDLIKDKFKNSKRTPSTDDDENDTDDEDDVNCEDDNDDDDDDSEEWSTEEECEDCSTDCDSDSKCDCDCHFFDDDTNEDEDDDDDDGEGEEEDDDDAEDEASARKRRKDKKEQEAAAAAAYDESEYLREQENINHLKNTLNDVISKDAGNTIARDTLKTILDKEKQLHDRQETALKTVKKVNVKAFKRLLRKKNSTNDLKYFREKMTPEEQRRIIAEMEAVHKVSLIEKPHRLALLETNIPVKYKAVALKKISAIRHMEPGCSEYHKLRTWVDTFMNIPFNVHRNLPLTMEDGITRCSEFMENARTILDEAVYGLNDAKLQIMQMLGQWIANPSAMGTAIAINGSAGTGKTSIVKDGISKILGRDFAFIALGGATDSSFLEGHSYTYEGSTWGKIVDTLIHCKSMNPIFYFDELDKISDTPKGEEIAGILTHLTDTTQNSQFHDKYFSEIDFDLSKCLFIFSYNDETKVNPILLDRMYRIKTSAYTKKDKTQIAQNYLMPKIRREVNFNEGEIIIPDEVIEYIIENYTEGEDGVRNLKRCLEIVHTKLNLYRLIKPGTQLFDKDLSMEVAFPFTVTTASVQKLIKKSDSHRSAPLSLYL